MRRRIIKSLIDQASPDPKKPVFVFDTDLAGFTLKVLPSGKKVFQLRYRMGGRDTPKRTFTIGSYGAFTPDQARKQAQILIGKIKTGVDPAAEKASKAAEEKSAVTLATIAAKFMELYAKRRRTRTIEEYEKLLRRVILPKFGQQYLKHIAAKDVERWHQGLQSTPYQANRALAVFSKLMSWAAQSGYREGDNPCRGVEKFQETPRRRYLSPTEIAALGDAIRVCEIEGSISPFVAGFFRLMLFTGMRKDELRLLTWDRVDFSRRVLILEELDAKAGRRDVPLSSPALQILAELPRLGGNPFVFPGKLKGRPVVNVTKPWKRIIVKSGIEHARLHDLRHTVGSVGVSTGASLLLIGGVLGHKSQQATNRYAHLADHPVRATAEAIGERMAAALESRDVVATGGK